MVGYRAPIVAILVTTLLLTFAAPAARAADTLEPFGIGATDVEFYAGYDGFGLRRLRDQAVFGELVLGYGLLERLSAIAGTLLQGNGLLAEGSGNLYIGIYGTPLDTRHVDLDLILTVQGGGSGFRQFRVSPAFELNLDRHPDMRSYGLYLRAGAHLEGRVEEAPAPPSEAPCRFGATLFAVLGAYYRVARRHQLLLEIDGAYRPRPCAEEQRLELGAVALGYNVTLSERIELINHVYLDLPQARGERPAAGFYVGFIVSLPSVSSPPPVAARPAPRPAPRPHPQSPAAPIASH